MEHVLNATVEVIDVRAKAVITLLSIGLFSAQPRVQRTRLRRGLAVVVGRAK